MSAPMQRMWVVRWRIFLEIRWSKNKWPSHPRQFRAPQLHTVPVHVSFVFIIWWRLCTCQESSFPLQVMHFTTSPRQMDWTITVWLRWRRWVPSRVGSWTAQAMTPFVTWRGRGEWQDFRQNKRVRKEVLEYPVSFILIISDSWYDSNLWSAERNSESLFT